MTALKIVLILTFIMLLIAFAVPPTAPTSTLTQPLLDSITTNSCNGFYILQPGDTLENLAVRCNITVNNILVANPWIRDTSLITPGVRINLPGSRSIAVQTSENVTGIPVTGETALLPETGSRLYIVVQGDTMSGVAARFGTTISEMMQINPAITDPDLIYTGQVLFIP